MNATLAVLLLGATAGQPPAAPAADYLPWKSRTITLPLQFKKERVATIRHAILFVSEDQGQTWSQEKIQPPTLPEFTYTARGDGRFWFNYVLVDMQGKRDIPDLTKDPNAMKVLIDATPPKVRFTTARRNGDDVAVEWVVDDKFPNDAATRVHFRPAGSPDLPWQEVTLPTDGGRNGVRFPAGTPGAVQVKVTASDLVGNAVEAVQEVANAVAGTVAARPAGVPPLPDPAASAFRPAPPAGEMPPPDSLSPVAAVMPAAPVFAAAPAPVVPPAAAPPVVPSAAPAMPAPAGPAPIASGQGVAPPAPPPPAAPVATTDMVPPARAVPPAVPGGYSPVIAAGSGPVAGPSVELSRTQVVNAARFDLNYEVEGRGPSGISRIDLFVTRDDGQTWVKWSQHDGRDPAVRVTLDVQANPQVEGAYGFRLVPVSGAGLSDGAPVNGRTAPDMRVIVDTTPPYIELYQPAADRAAPDALVIRWKATDKHFGPDPITIEYAELPTGPWKPVAAGAGETVVQASAVTGAAPRRLANSGEFSWRVPPGMPPRVYLKVTARDAAGNTSEVVTPQPITVDTMTPRAKIQGIVPAAPVALPRP